MTVWQIIGTVFLFIGVIFIFIGALGVLRMPDVYNKLQAGTKATTLGFVSVAVGAIWIEPGWAWKLLVVTLFILATNPIGSHALARAAKKQGVPLVLSQTGEEKKK